MVNDQDAFLSFLFYDRKLDKSRKKQFESQFKVFYGFFSDKTFNRLTFTDFVRHLLEVKKHSEATVNLYITLGKNYELFKGTSHLADFKYFKVQDKQIDSLTVKEIQALAGVHVQYRFKSDYLNRMYGALIMFLSETGCRIDEALSLTKRDLYTSPCHVLFQNTKNGKSRRVPIRTELCETLKTLSQCDWVFTSYRGERLKGEGINQELKRRSKLCGIKKNVYNHLFRHSFVDECRRQGISIVHVARMVGHEDIQTTNKYYSHVEVEELAEAMRVHPLLRGKVALEDITKKLTDVASRLIDSSDYDLVVSKKEGSISLEVSKRQ